MATRTREADNSAAPPTDALLLGMSDIEARLRLSRPSLYALINNGTLRTFRVGARRYSTPEFLQECVAQLAGNSETDARRALQVRSRRRRAR